MEYVYPAVFHPNEDGSYTICYPDLPGCISEGKSLANAMYMAQSALTEWLDYMTDKGLDIPTASSMGSVVAESGEFVNLIRAEVKDESAVKRTVSIPKWMDEKVRANNLSLSRVLQDSLRERLDA